MGIICNPNYLSMIEVPRLRILGVPMGTQCQQYLGGPIESQVRRRGFVFDDGTGLGAYIENAPALTLPIINPVTGESYNTPPGFPFLIIGTGSNPHAWRFVQGKTGVAATLQWDGTLWRVLEAGSAPGLVTACTSGVSGSVALFGCIQTGLDGDGNPVYALRKLTARDKRAVVGAIDGDGNQTFHSLADNEILEHPLGKFTLLRFNTIQAITDGGADETDGLPLMATYGTGGVTDGIATFYSPTTKKLYRRPPGIVNAMSVGQMSLTANTFTNIFTWASVVLNYKALLVTAQFCTGSEISTVDVLLDGVIKQAFNSQNPAATAGTETSTNIGATVVLSGITPGVHTVVVRLKCKTGATLFTGAASVASLDLP